MTLQSIGARMLLAALLPVALVATLTAVLFLILGVGEREESHQQRARLLTRQLASASEYGVFSGNLASLQSIASGALRQADVLSVIVTDSKGEVLVRAGNAGSPDLPPLTREETSRVNGSDSVDRLTQPIVAAEVRLEDTLESTPDGKPAIPQLLGHVVMEVSRAALAQRERELMALGALITLTGLLFGGILSLLMGRGVIRPLLRVSRMIVDIGRGKLSVRQDVLPDDPLREVQLGLNQMAARLEANQEDMLQRIELATSALREKKEEAELATRAKSQFLAAASHDLRQPTHALGMFVARLGQLTHDEPTTQLVEHLEASVRVLQDLLDGLLDISRLDAGAVPVNVGAVSLNTVFDQVQRAVADAAIAKGLRLRVRSTTTWVLSDPVLLYQIVFNLVANAVRYTQQGSILLVCRVSQTRRVARIEVWDSGIGIAPEHHQQVFKEFFQVGNLARDRQHGLGLGLNIVQRTAGLLGHEIDLRSRLNQGTRFMLELPLTDPAPPRLAVPADEMQTTGHFEGRHILVIEDDALVLAALAELLTSWGCVVSRACDLATAASQIKLNGTPHVIVSDYRLTGIDNGIDVVLALRAITGQAIPACLASGDTDPGLLHRAKATGLTLLHKPVRPAKLRSLLNSLLS